MKNIRVKDARLFDGQTVAVKGWLYNKRSSGKLLFAIIRDGTGIIQCVASLKDLGEGPFTAFESLHQESSLKVWGEVHKDPRAPGGHELSVKGLEVIGEALPDYPISLKEHGPDFLLDNRHLWIRTPTQRAVLSVRAEVMKACRDFLDQEGFLEVSSPIFTPSSCEGTSTLFATDYFGEKAYLTQSGQLYVEAAIMALERVYCFGPTFRAEKSKTRRHLTEFWMVEPEAAFMDFQELLVLEENMISFVAGRVLENRGEELKVLGRNPHALSRISPPFPRMTYDEAVRFLQNEGFDIKWGDDFGAPHETALAKDSPKPVFVTHYPTAIKAFYMEPDPKRPEVALAADMLAPEGYGEIIGGSERIRSLELLKERIAEHNLPFEEYEWYLDLRRFGTVPHSGFGLGVERLVSWLCGLDHLREAIPFPRTINRLRP